MRFSLQDFIKLKPTAQTCKPKFNHAEPMDFHQQIQRGNPVLHLLSSFTDHLDQ
jgi:hypothetical protein